MTSSVEKLVDLNTLSISFKPDSGAGNATVEKVDFTIAKGEFVALVGESGSGKSLLAHSIAGILSPSATVSSERFTFAGADMSDRSGPSWKNIRGREIGMVFQNPRGALNPVRSVGLQIADVIAHHRLLRGRNLKSAVLEALAAVRIPDPVRRYDAYPAELSGGMCQRVMMAIALAGDPALLIADEPTTGLDTTTQRAMIELILQQAEERKMACLLITHDLALARQFAERIIVMHAGQIVEEATAAKLFEHPRHPYTAALMNAMPSTAETVEELAGISGSFPNLRQPVPACRFADRCERSIDQCQIMRPELTGPNDQRVACWRAL